MITLIKGNLGPGILNLPHAFALAGYGLGSVLFFVVSLQGLYSMWLLVSCQQRLQQQQNQQHNNTSLTFMGVARRVLGPYGGRAVEVFLLVSQGGVCCVFLSLLSTHLQATFLIRATLSVSLVTVVLLGLVLLRWIADLVWLSTVANVCMLLALGTATGMGVLVRYGTIAPSTTATHLVAARMTPAVMTTFTTDMFYALEGIGLVLPVANAYATTASGTTMMNGGDRTTMTTTTPTKPPFGRVLLQSMTLVAGAFLVTGLGAAVGFPDNHSGSITEYLQATYPNVLWFRIVNSLVMLAVGMTFPLQLTPAAEVVETWVSQWNEHKRGVAVPQNDEDANDGVMIDVPISHATSTEDATATTEPPPLNTSESSDAVPQLDDTIPLSPNDSKAWIVQRWSMVLFFAAIVLAVDDLGVLMSLFGAVGQTTLAAMPCVVHLAMQYQGLAPRCWWQTVIHLAIVTFCGFVLLAGVVQCIREELRV